MTTTQTSLERLQATLTEDSGYPGAAAVGVADRLAQSSPAARADQSSAPRQQKDQKEKNEEEEEELSPRMQQLLYEAMQAHPSLTREKALEGLYLKGA